MTPSSGQRVARFLDVTLDLGLRHAGIMFQRHRRDAVVAADAGEGRDRADIGAPVRQPRDLGADVEVLALDADGQPLSRSPVIGGKNAISRAPAICVSGFTWLRSIAARITLAFSNA